MTGKINDIHTKIEIGHEKEPEYLEDHEKTRKDLENKKLRLEIISLNKDIEQREKFGKNAFIITLVWVGFLMLLTIAQFFCKVWSIGLSGVEFNVVFSTTTGSVLVFWYLVGKYLFRVK